MLDIEEIRKLTEENKNKIGNEEFDKCIKDIENKIEECSKKGKGYLIYEFPATDFYIVDSISLPIRDYFKKLGFNTEYTDIPRILTISWEIKQ